MALVATSANSRNFSYPSCTYEWPALTQRSVNNVGQERMIHDLSSYEVESGNTADGKPQQPHHITDRTAQHAALTAGSAVHTLAVTHAGSDIGLPSQRIASGEPEVMEQLALPSCDLAMGAIAPETKENFGDTDHPVNSVVEDKSCDDTITSVKPPDVRPKVFRKRDICCNHSETQAESFKETGKLSTQRESVHSAGNEDEYADSVSKKQKRHKKVREKTNKKWKPFQPTDLGFRVSRLALCPSEDPAPSEGEDTNDSLDLDSVLTATSTVGENMETSIASGDTGLEVDTKNTMSDIDDVTYFRELGIDVLNDDYNDNRFDEFLDWDGVSFPWEDQTSLASKKAILSSQNGKTQSQNVKTTNLANKAGKRLTSRAPESKIKASARSSVKSKTSQPDIAEAVPYFPSPFPSPKIKKCDRYKLFELETSSSKRIYIRRDRHRRVEKAHIAVKSKNCVSIFNNRGRKNLYMHHRLIKMHSLCLDFRHSARAGPVPRMPKKNVDLDVAKGIIRADCNARGATHIRGRPAPAQNLKHALHDTNAPGHLERDLASFLISLQHREMTPEDYDMLLRLDDTVKPKTVSKSVLDTLRTETVGSEAMGLMCTICMEPYISGQQRKFLPCNHDFHSGCIDMWLKNSSMNCPLDGLPVESS